MARISGIDEAAWASPWRGIPVGTKVIFSMTLVIMALLAPPWPTAVLITALGLGVLTTARIPGRFVAAAFGVPAVFIVLGAASATVTLGEFEGPGWRWGILGIRQADVGLGVGLLLRSVAGTCAVFVLAMTTPMVDLLAWLRRCRVPAPLIEVASLMYRMIFIAWNSLLEVRQAQQQRLGGTGSPRDRFAEAGRLVGSVAVRTWLASARLADGLAIRGHESHLTTLPPRRQPHRIPGWAAAGVVLIVGVALWVR
ncbi:cobalt ECF transporter T component CbiQ [Arachnia propionica]|uniref:Cobalt ECF transporter T component CbiQ n=1 Tax=Arachnia propionica TaxID=1750 RepID=A0A3P1T2K1_9ACTN|nr:cobalt ECF transporter T component CbiQ [Arachnia propionica]MDO5082294.1 cobalt ECF transporter T component CbiQ [Arachnia propionica]RRD03488.1 cobalt ECF transporter T component CbiQ [Arachnia propionica]